MEKFNDIKRPSESLINALSKLTSATASGELSRMGIKDPSITGPVTYSSGKKIIGPALTLQFLPIREDIYYDDEYTDPEEQLHRQVLYFTKPGDIVVVDARGSMNSGVFGEMMLSFFKGRGGEGIVIDGCIRDYASSKDLNLGIWMKGVTPNYHTQTSIFPSAVNVPISCGNTLVMPGDIIIADDDGAVVIPIDYAQKLSDVGGAHQEWEIFVKEKLIDGGHLKDYYPKHSWSEKIETEYKKWLKKNKGKL